MSQEGHIVLKRFHLRCIYNVAFSSTRFTREVLRLSVHYVSDQVIQEGTVACGLFNTSLPLSVTGTEKNKAFLDDPV